MVTEHITMSQDNIHRTKNNAASLEVAQLLLNADRVLYVWSKKNLGICATFNRDRCNLARSIRRVEELLGLPHRFHANGRKIR